MATLVGTASWAEKTLIDCKRFYPPGVSSAEGRLRYYASIFPVVEVDSSYCGSPHRPWFRTGRHVPPSTSSST